MRRGREREIEVHCDTSPDLPLWRPSSLSIGSPCWPSSPHNLHHNVPGEALTKYPNQKLRVDCSIGQSEETQSQKSLRRKSNLTSDRQSNAPRPRSRAATPQSSWSVKVSRKIFRRVRRGAQGKIHTARPAKFCLERLEFNSILNQYRMNVLRFTIFQPCSTRRINFI